MNNQDRNAKGYCVNNCLELPRSATENFKKETMLDFKYNVSGV